MATEVKNCPANAPAAPAPAPAAAKGVRIAADSENSAPAVGPQPLESVVTSEKDKERLAQRIARRPSKADLKLRNIIRVDSSESIAQKAASSEGAVAAQPPTGPAPGQGSIQERSLALKSCLKKRPERQELMDKNILKEADSPTMDNSLVQAAEQLKRAQLLDTLESRLAARPNPDELPPRVLKFDESVEVLPTFRKTEYNRRPDSNSTFRKLTPKLKMEIREELNSFKRNEMPVHADSINNTAFH